MTGRDELSKNSERDLVGRLLPEPSPHSCPADPECSRTRVPGWGRAGAESEGRRSRRQEIRSYATTTNSLLERRDWLVAEQVTLVVLEATGDYWRGAFYLLEDDLNVILVNAAHAKGLPGRKTDSAMPRGCVRWVSADCCERRSCRRSRSDTCGI